MSKLTEEQKKEIIDRFLNDQQKPLVVAEGHYGGWLFDSTFDDIIKEKFRCLLAIEAKAQQLEDHLDDYIHGPESKCHIRAEVAREILAAGSKALGGSDE